MKMEPSSEDVKYLADTLAKAIRDGFADLGNRIAQGTNPENVAMSLKLIADNLEPLAPNLERVAEAIGLPD